MKDTQAVSQRYESHIQYGDFYQITYINNEEWFEFPCIKFIHDYELNDYTTSPNLHITDIKLSTYAEFKEFWDNYEEEL